MLDRDVLTCLINIILIKINSTSKKAGFEASVLIRRDN